MKARMFAAVVAAAGLTFGMTTPAAAVGRSVTGTAELNRWLTADGFEYRQLRAGDDFGIYNHGPAVIRVRLISCDGARATTAVRAPVNWTGTPHTIVRNGPGPVNSCWNLQYQASGVENENKDFEAVVRWQFNWLA